METQILLSATVSDFISGGAATGNLSGTSLIDAEIFESMSDAALPAPVLIGLEGRTPPAEIVISDSDSDIIDGINLQDAADAAATPFNPDIDAIDFQATPSDARTSRSGIRLSSSRRVG